MIDKNAQEHGLVGPAIAFTLAAVAIATPLLLGISLCGDTLMKQAIGLLAAPSVLIAAGVRMVVLARERRSITGDMQRLRGTIAVPIAA